MKKLTALLLALMMACMMVPAMADDALLGEWYLKTMKAGETEYDAAAIGMAITMTLNADGTVAMMMPDSETPETGTWTLDGDQITVTINDSPASGPASAESITLAADGQEMIFTREAVSAITVAEVKAAESAEEFYGTWSLKFVEMEGRVMDVAALGETDSVVTISDATVECTGEGTLSSVLSLMKLDAPVFEDGALSIKAAADALNPDMTAKAEMLEDGMVKLTVTSTSDMILYLVPAEVIEEGPAA